MMMPYQYNTVFPTIELVQVISNQWGFRLQLLKCFSFLTLFLGPSCFTLPLKIFKRFEFDIYDIFIFPEKKR